MKNASGTGPFSPFEWLVAFRYLRARRKEGLISVFAGFSFLGIALGVATLIIVMAVMNGFRQELFNKMLGLNGHIIVHSMEGGFKDYDPVASRHSGRAGRQIRASLDRRPSAAVFAAKLDRRPGAGLAGSRSQETESDRRQYQVRHAGRLGHDPRRRGRLPGLPTR